MEQHCCFKIFYFLIQTSWISGHIQADLFSNIEAIVGCMAGLEHTWDLCLSNEDQKVWDMALIIRPPTNSSAIFIYSTGQVL